MSEYGSKWLTPYGEKKLSKREKQLQADSALRLMDDFIDAENERCAQRSFRAVPSACEAR